MLRIGEFSKLSHLTVKALRFYEKEGILMPASIDEWTGYRYYETTQLNLAAKIKAYRQLDLSIEEIKSIINGLDARAILQKKAEALSIEREHLDNLISSINYILEDKEMKYTVTEKVVPACIVYYSEATLANYSDIMQWIPALGEECVKLNPSLKCAEPPYEFCEYLDEEYKEQNIRIRHNEAVVKKGNENETIKFRDLPETKVLSVMHKGPYDTISEAYAFILSYAKENGYECTDYIRECYIDGIWNKEDPADWLTEVQMPIG